MAGQKGQKPDLTGWRILIVEDDYVIAGELAKAFQAFGAEILGPAPTVERAIALVRAPVPPDAAVLDLNLRGLMVYPVADALVERGVPFVFATGYDASGIPGTYRDIRRFEKPADPAKIALALRPPLAGCCTGAGGEN